MNAYHRNDRPIYANVLTFERKRRREWRAVAAQVALWLGIATVLTGALWYVVVGVVVR